MKFKKFKYWSDETKGNLLRIWSVGAVYFFIGWGTPLGKASTYYDIIFFLALGITLMTLVVINPIIRGMLKTSLDLKYNETSILHKVKNRLLIFFESLILVTLVVYTYQFINQAFVNIYKLAETTITLPAEPILFTTFYFIYYFLLIKLKKLVLKIFKKER